MKASIPFMHRNPYRLYNILHFGGLTAVSIQLKKPSVARRAYRPPSPRGFPNTASAKSSSKVLAWAKS